MIDWAHDLPVTRQAEVLGISRGSVYYLPPPDAGCRPCPDAAIDELHQDYPFAGNRMLQSLLKLEA